MLMSNTQVRQVTSASQGGKTPFNITFELASNPGTFLSFNFSFLMHFSPYKNGRKGARQGESIFPRFNAHTDSFIHSPSFTHQGDHSLQTHSLIRHGLTPFKTHSIDSHGHKWPCSGSVRSTTGFWSTSAHGGLQLYPTKEILKVKPPEVFGSNGHLSVKSPPHSGHFYLPPSLKNKTLREKQTNKQTAERQKEENKWVSFLLPKQNV